MFWEIAREAILRYIIKNKVPKAQQEIQNV